MFNVRRDILIDPGMLASVDTLVPGSLLFDAMTDTWYHVICAKHTLHYSTVVIDVMAIRTPSYKPDRVERPGSLQKLTFIANMKYSDWTVIT